MTTIQWRRVTWYSQLIAIILFIGVFCVGFYVGGQYELVHEIVTPSPDAGNTQSAKPAVASAVFTCSSGKSITAQFYADEVKLNLSDKRELTLPHAVSASGARYANADESIVFWNKGTSAFLQEGTETTFADCVTPVKAS